MNSDYEALGYESTSILSNANELFTTISYGLITWILVFAARAILFTLQGDALKKIDAEISNFEGNEDKNVFEESKQTLNKNDKSKKKKVKKWTKSKKVIKFLFFRQSETNECGVQIQFLPQAIPGSLPWTLSH